MSESLGESAWRRLFFNMKGKDCSRNHIIFVSTIIKNKIRTLILFWHSIRWKSSSNVPKIPLLIPSGYLPFKSFLANWLLTCDIRLTPLSLFRISLKQWATTQKGSPWCIDKSFFVITYGAALSPSCFKKFGRLLVSQHFKHSWRQISNQVTLWNLKLWSVINFLYNYTFSGRDQDYMDFGANLFYNFQHKSASIHLFHVVCIV